MYNYFSLYALYKLCIIDLNVIRLICFRMWCLIILYNDEDIDEKRPYLIPSDQILNELNCWYPVDYKMLTIKKYAKNNKLLGYNKWKNSKIDIIEENIGNLLILYNLLSSMNACNKNV